MQLQQQLCRIPKSLLFEYHQNQQLNSTLIIDNLLDKVVDYKIMSNKPELYLVKPMQGSIYKNQSVKIVFKRKQLLKSQFQAYLRNPASIQEKFLIQIKCQQQDVIGMQKTLTQSAIVFVKFNLQSKQPEVQMRVTSDQRRQQLSNQLKIKIQAKENQLTRLKQQENKIDAKIKIPKEDFKIMKIDVINIFVFMLLVGLAFGG